MALSERELLSTSFCLTQKLKHWRRELECWRTSVRKSNRMRVRVRTPGQTEANLVVGAEDVDELVVAAVEGAGVLLVVGSGVVLEVVGAAVEEEVDVIAVVAVGTQPPTSLVMKPALQMQSEMASLPAGANEFAVQLKQKVRPGETEYVPASDEV
jgi:hypothetical protein